MNNILIVDDEPEVRHVYGMALENAGFAVHLVGTGEDALEWARLHPPDVVVCDLHLPGMDGIETVAAMLAIAPTVKVILTSGDGGAEWEVLRRPGVRDDFVSLAKPFRLARLVDLVAREIHYAAP